VLTPAEALERYLAARERLGRIDVAGIAGPGDALANFENTRETFALIREVDSEVTFCISTNGLLLPRYAADLVLMGVSHVTVTVNAVKVSTAKRIYRFIDYEGERILGEKAAEILLENQYAGLGLLKETGVICKVNIVMLKDLNDGEIPGIIERVKDAGADIANIMQLIPVKGSLFESMPLVSNLEITELRKRCESILPQMYHCHQCRADAVGTLDDDIGHVFEANDCGGQNTATVQDLVPEGNVLRFAVASKNGAVVDEHFGHVTGFHIYEYKNGQARFVERREISQYCAGPRDCSKALSIDHDSGMRSILETIHDCSGVIAMRIGDYPRQLLAAEGIKTFTTYEYAVDAVRKAAEAYVT
jgi:MoaA/NifB/PqqE/SkfB family radical SAM enzyme